MNVTDYLVIAGIVISAVVGALRGFLREAVALVTWVVALFVAWHFSDMIEPHLGGLLAGSAVRVWAARTILVVVILLVGTGLGAALSHFVRVSIFSGTDRALGLLFGAFRGLILFGVLIIVGQLLRLEDERWWRQSTLIPYRESIANGLRTLVGEHPVHRGAQRL